MGVIKWGNTLGPCKPSCDGGVLFLKCAPLESCFKEACTNIFANAGGQLMLSAVRHPLRDWLSSKPANPL